jgi:hypothetical protein
MSDQRLTSLQRYSAFVGEVLDRPMVVRSTVAVWSESPCTGTAEGEVDFNNGLRLRMREELDFLAGPAFVAPSGCTEPTRAAVQFRR